MRSVLFLTCLLLEVVLVSLKGLLFSVFWTWFIVPIFNFPVISTAQAVGVILVFAIATHQRIPDDNEDLVEQIKKIIVSYLAKLIAWALIGLIFHFMFL